MSRPEDRDLTPSYEPQDLDKSDSRSQETRAEKAVEKRKKRRREERGAVLETKRGLVSSLKSALGLGKREPLKPFTEIEKERGDALWDKNTSAKEARVAQSDQERQEALRRQAEAVADLETVDEERQAYFKTAEESGLVDDLMEKVAVLKQESQAGQIFPSDLVSQLDTEIEEGENIPEEFKGVRAAYYREKVGELIRASSGQSLSEQGKEAQREYIRNKLSELGVANVTAEDFKNNLAWVQLRSIVLNFHPDVVAEFRARVEVSKFADNFRGQGAFDKSVEGSEAVVAADFAAVLEVEEIGQAFDLLEQNSDIAPRDLVTDIEVDQSARAEITFRESRGERLKREDKKEIKKNIRNQKERERIGKVNIIYAQSSTDRDRIYNQIAEDLARLRGETINDENRERIIVRYRKFVDEAANAWWTMYRGDGKAVNFGPKGGIAHISKLLHLGGRIESKKFGPKQIRERFNKPFLPTQMKKYSERMRRLGQEEGRGIGVDDFTTFAFSFINKNQLRELGFEVVGRQKVKDGMGREWVMVTFRHQTTGMEVYYSTSETKKDLEGWETKECLGVVNVRSEVMSEALTKTPEAIYQMYTGSLFPAEGTRKEFAKSNSVLRLPLGCLDVSEEDIFRRIQKASEDIFQRYDPLSKDEKRVPGKYYQEDAWEDLLIGTIRYGLTREARRRYPETWGQWRARRADMIISAARRAGVIGKDQEMRIVKEASGGKLGRLLINAGFNPYIVGSIERFIGKNIDVPLGVWRTKGFKPFFFFSAIFGILGELWKGFTEDLPISGGGGGGPRRRK